MIVVDVVGVVDVVAFDVDVVAAVVAVAVAVAAVDVVVGLKHVDELVVTC